MTTLTFNPGETTKTISININGDRLKENNEVFYVKLTSNTSGTLKDCSRHRHDPERRLVTI